MSHTWTNSPDLKQTGLTTVTKTEPVQRNPTQVKTIKQVKDSAGNVISEEVVEIKSTQGDIITGNVPNKPQGAVEGKVLTDTQAIQQVRNERANQDLDQSKTQH